MGVIRRTFPHAVTPQRLWSKDGLHRPGHASEEQRKEAGPQQEAMGQQGRQRAGEQAVSTSHPNQG